MHSENVINWILISSLLCTASWNVVEFLPALFSAMQAYIPASPSSVLTTSREERREDSLPGMVVVVITYLEVLFSCIPAKFQLRLGRGRPWAVQEKRTEVGEVMVMKVREGETEVKEGGTGDGKGEETLIMSLEKLETYVCHNN